MKRLRITHEEYVKRVQEKYGDSIEIVSQFKGITEPIDFIYKCEHGEIRKTVKRAEYLSAPQFHRCYCRLCRNPCLGKFYIGAEFGWWTIIDTADSYVTNSGGIVCQWLCRCKCGTERVVAEYLLTNKGRKTICSCGCSTKEMIKERKNSGKPKPNRYEITDGYATFYTNRNEPFYVDLEDIEKVVGHAWCKNGSGYLSATINRKTILLHRYLMDCPDDMVVDHIGGSETKHDNRKSNLRLATRQQNAMNLKKHVANTSGYTGVYYNKQTQKWVAQIGIGIYENTGKKHCMYLGSYDNKEDAIIARKQAEDKYFGEFSRNNSIHIEKENTNGIG